VASKPAAWCDAEAKPATWCLFKRNGPLWKGEDGVWHWDENDPITISNRAAVERNLNNPAPPLDLHFVRLSFSYRMLHSLLFLLDRTDSSVLRLRVRLLRETRHQWHGICASVCRFCSNISSSLASIRKLPASVSDKSKVS